MTLAGYKYRSEIPIGYVSGGETDILMELTIHKGAGSNSPGNLYLNNKINNWPDDIAITESDGTLVPFVRLWSDASDQLLLLNLPTIPSSGSEVYYVYSYSTTASDLDSGVGCNVADFADPLRDRKKFVTDHYHSNGSDYPNQGVCADGAGNYFLSGKSTNDTITKWNSSGVKQLEVDVEATYHIGDLCYNGGKVWAALSAYPSEDNVVRIRSYSPTDLSENSGDAQNLTNTGKGDAGSLDFYDGYWWVATWSQANNKTWLLKYNTSWVLQASYEFSDQSDLWDQSNSGLENGIAWKDDKLYVAGHDATYGGLFIYVWVIDSTGKLRYINKHSIASEGQGICWDGDTFLSISRADDRTYFSTLEADSDTVTMGGGWNETEDSTTDVWSLVSNTLQATSNASAWREAGRNDIYFDVLGHDYVLYRVEWKSDNTTVGGGINIHRSNKYVGVFCANSGTAWRYSAGYVDASISWSADTWYVLKILYRKSDGLFNLYMNGTWSGWISATTTTKNFAALALRNSGSGSTVQFRGYYAGKSLETLPAWDTPSGPSLVRRGAPFFW